MPEKPSLPPPPTPRQNRLIAALPMSEYELLSHHLELVPMPLGEALYESGNRLTHVQFPTSAIVSLLYVMENGAPSEIAMVGNEGVVGISLFLGGETMPSRAVVQSAGHAYQLSGHLLKQEFDRGGALQHLLLRYTLAMLIQMAQAAVCNAPPFSGPAGSRRWLLQPRPPAIERYHHDTGADRQHAGCTARGRYRGRPENCRVRA